MAPQKTRSNRNHTKYFLFFILVSSFVVMYADLIKSKFPHNTDLDMYVQPNLPAVKLGKVLAKDTRIASPSDVVAVHMHGGMFSSSLVILTSEKCFYPDGSFLLEDAKEATMDGKNLIVTANRLGAISQHKFSVKDEEAAQVLKKVLSAIAYHDPKMEQKVAATYENFDYNPAEINWLKLRDEIMRTIDLLTERFNDGKISLLQLEEKKEELLNRL